MGRWGGGEVGEKVREGGGRGRREREEGERGDYSNVVYTC